MPITAPAPALTTQRPPGLRNALPGWLDGMVALFTGALRDTHQRRGGQPGRADAAGGETEDVA
jgi:hypothetical protein